MSREKDAVTVARLGWVRGVPAGSVVETWSLATPGVKIVVERTEGWPEEIAVMLGPKANTHRWQWVRLRPTGKISRHMFASRGDAMRAAARSLRRRHPEFA